MSKEIITKNDVGVLEVKGMELEEFKKLIEIDEVPKCDSDMIKCSACQAKMGIKKWARLATKEQFTCPACGATCKAKTKLKVAFKEKSRFKIESVEAGEASVEVREDGTKHYRETLHVKVKPVVAAK